jgi:hypothetical protein
MSPGRPSRSLGEWAGFQPGKAHPEWYGVHPALAVVGSEVLLRQLAHVRQAVRNRAIALDLGTVGDQDRPLRAPSRSSSLHSGRVEPMNPLPQGLPVHSPGAKAISGASKQATPYAIPHIPATRCRPVLGSVSNLESLGLTIDRAAIRLVIWRVIATYDARHLVVDHA